MAYVKNLTPVPNKKIKPTTSNSVIINHIIAKKTNKCVIDKADSVIVKGSLFFEIIVIIQEMPTKINGSLIIETIPEENPQDIIPLPPIIKYSIKAHAEIMNGILFCADFSINKTPLIFYLLYYNTKFTKSQFSSA